MTQIDTSNSIQTNSPTDSSSLNILGSHNSIYIGENVQLLNCAIKINGNSNKIIVQERCYFHNSYVGIEANDSTIIIESGTTIGAGGVISCHEPGNIFIGRDCNFSINVFIDNSDMHPIFDAASDSRINFAKDIFIGDHCWLGIRVIILKGVHLEGGNVVAAGSVVSDSITLRPSNSILAGCPAKVVKNNIYWKRNFSE